MENGNNYDHNHDYDNFNNTNSTNKLDIFTIIINNYFLIVLFTIIAVCTFLFLILVCVFIIKYYSKHFYCSSPNTRIKRQKGINIEMGKMNHNIVENTNQE
jgi:predicted ABC-type sugar transport system permease subunit